jgi:hypothetical protein
LTASNGLAEARAERNRWRSVLKSGRDPITVRRQEEQAKALAAAGTITFKQAADEFIATQVANSRWRAKATEIEWRGQFETYAAPVLGTLAMADITAQLIDRVLKPIWGHPVLGQRVRQRLEELFDAAIALGYRATENPCRLRRVKHALGKRAKHKPTNFAAMAVSEIGAFVAELRERQIAAPADPSPWALEFLVLTTVRVGQVRWMRWREVDLVTATWISPGAEWDTRGGLVAKGHTKSGRDHRVAPMSAPCPFCGPSLANIGPTILSSRVRSLGRRKAEIRCVSGCTDNSSAMTLPFRDSAAYFAIGWPRGPSFPASWLNTRSTMSRQSATKPKGLISVMTCSNGAALS